MTVKELIKILQEHPQDAQIAILDDNWGGGTLLIHTVIYDKDAHTVELL